MKPTMNKKAFTLVEIICVVAIIVILATVLITGFVSLLPKYKDDITEVGSTQKQMLLEADNAADTATANESQSDSIDEPVDDAVPNSNTTGGGSSANSSGSLNASNSAGQDLNIDENTTSAPSVKELNKFFTTDLVEGDLTTLGKCIASNKAKEINDMMSASGVKDAQAFVTNCGGASSYANKVVTSSGITPLDMGNTKILSVTVDGTVLSDHKKNDKVEVVQYLYYEVKENNNKVVKLYGYRTTTATVSKVIGDGALNFDQSDTNGSSWTVVE